MRTFHARCVALALGLSSLASGVQAHEGTAPALFPIPSPVAYPVAQTARESAWYDQASPSDVVAPADVVSTGDHGEKQSPQQAISPDYHSAMKGGWDSCTSPAGCATGCNAGCCPSHYVYANGLIMTHEKNGGFVTSVDAGSGDPALLFCSPEYGGLWHGGFELGTGWCFGCNCNQALEVVYWGLYAAPGTSIAEGNLNSQLDFGNLNYDGAGADALYDGAATHRLIFDQGFHSLEVNMIGNYGGPLGCGRTGCCGTGCGERWGFGWLAGFRYMNFTEDWMFSTEFDDNVFNNDADQLNYEVDLQNNMFGFQLGLGLDYCITERLQAYVIGKAGIYGNDIQMQQRMFGSAGNAVLNAGPFSGNEFVVEATDFDLSMASQIDLGARYAINQSWSVDFGYRVLGLSGVAITEDNAAQGNFQNVEGIADIQTTGSLLLHGGYIGATYAW